MTPNFLSAVLCGEAFCGLGVHYVKSFILVDALFLLDGGKRRERKKERKKKKLPWERMVSLGLYLPCWLCCE
jgi:hypothetical protein